MPLSEFYRMTKGKVEGSQPKTTTCSPDLAFVSDNELVELVWESGQIMMQGQSSRSRKTPKIPTSNNLHFQTPRFRDKKYGTIDSICSDIATSVPSGEMGLSQDDDMVPWFNYPIEDTLQHDYCPDFLPELSGVTVNEPSTRNSFLPMDKRDRSNQIVRDSHNVSVHNGVSLGQGNASNLPSSRSSQLYSWSLPQGQTSVGSRVSDIISSNTSNTHHGVSGNLIPEQAPAGLFSQTKMKNQDSGLPNSNSSLLNFSHFSRPAAMSRANIQNASTSCRNPAESTHLENRVLRKEMNFQTQPNLGSAKVDSKPLEIKPLEKSNIGGQSESVCREDANKDDKSHNEARGGNTTKVVPENEKIAEPVGPSSSVCSGNSVERASNEPTVNLKRKNCLDTESEDQSEDVEEESVGVKKAAPARGGSGSKRSRAAEVHNLSERRRRDRINEKMRALQELIPNCNKVDKASMLDEAIEYLKTLQLQVQIMSMGAGLYMPHMMLPPGMQHIHAAHLPHFSPMGVGMGMGMGFGMNMLDMNGGSRGCSMIPMPPMQSAHFLSPHISGPTSLQGMAAAHPQVLGHPSQGLPVSVAGTPFVPLLGRPPTNSATGMNASRMGVIAKSSNAVPNMGSKDLAQNINSQAKHSADNDISLNQQSSQFQAKAFEQVPKSDQGPDVGGSAVVNSTKTNNAVPSGEVSGL